MKAKTISSYSVGNLLKISTSGALTTLKKPLKNSTIKILQMKHLTKMTETKNIMKNKINTDCTYLKHHNLHKQNTKGIKAPTAINMGINIDDSSVS